MPTREEFALDIAGSNAPPVPFVWTGERSGVCVQHSGVGKDRDKDHVGKFHRPEVMEDGSPLHLAFIAASGDYGREVCRTCAIAFMVDLTLSLNEPIRSDVLPEYGTPLRGVPALDGVGAKVALEMFRAGSSHAEIAEAACCYEADVYLLLRQARNAEEAARRKQWTTDAGKARYRLYYLSRRMSPGMLAYRTGLPVSAIACAVNEAERMLRITRRRIADRINAGVHEVSAAAKQRAERTGAWYEEHLKRVEAEGFITRAREHDVAVRVARKAARARKNEPNAPQQMLFDMEEFKVTPNPDKE